jgi:prepilin-type N-terminal cleavage/methylation domain-containing protein
MKKGGNRSLSGGFTIVEVLIVLSVSALLAVSALVLVSGRQNKTEFMVAINNVQQQLQQIINETSSGYFPSGNFTCTAGATYPSIANGGSGQQGQNGDCIFIGKALRFGPSSGTTLNDFTAYPLAANRLVAGQEQTSPTATTFHFAPLAPGTPGTGVNSSALDESTPYPFKNQLTYKSATSLDNPTPTTPTPTISHVLGSSTMMVGFVTNLASYDGGGNLQSGSQQLGLYRFTGSWANVSGADVVDRLGAANLVSLNNVTLCFNSGSTNQSGVITIGGNGQQLSVALQIKDGPCHED